MHDRIDLHTHSNCSDGTLSPVELVALAATRSVQLLALTDHDTVAGCDAAREACATHGIEFVDGVELTATWRDREIHVVGLRIDPRHPALVAHMDDVARRRRARIVAIGERLARLGIDGKALAERALALTPVPTRLHMARLLVEQGHVATLDAAFDRYLGRGQPGHAPPDWPTVETVVQCIVAAGGVAVLAHPHRYKLSHGGQKELCAHFKAAGGRGIEVSLSGMGPGDSDRAASLARRFDLAGSVGSDFHEPGLPWRPLGRFAKLPDQIAPVTSQLGLAQASP